MRKLRIIEHISLDGVIQHSADGGDFPYSEWTAPYRTRAGRDAAEAYYFTHVRPQSSFDVRVSTAPPGFPTRTA